MFQMSSSLEEEAGAIMARSGANNLCLFLCSSSPGRAGVHFFYHYGMSHRIKQDYCTSLWRYDPFLKGLAGQEGSNTVIERGELERRTGDERQYWNYIDQVGYRDIVAAIHPFTAEHHLVAGVMGQCREKQYHPINRSQVLACLSDFVDHSARQLMTAAFAAIGPNAARLAEPVAAVSLSARERQVVSLLQTGLSNKQIAAHLSLSEYTVQNHFKRLFRKFDARNRTDLLCRVQAMGAI